MARIEARLRQEHLDRVEAKRRHARFWSAVAEVAREIELDPAKADRGSGRFFREGEPGYHETICRPGQEIPWWMHRAQELGVEVDPTTGPRIGNARALIAEARKLGVDIASMNGTECLVCLRGSTRRIPTPRSGRSTRRSIRTASRTPDSVGARSLRRMARRAGARSQFASSRTLVGARGALPNLPRPRVRWHGGRRGRISRWALGRNCRTRRTSSARSPSLMPSREHGSLVSRGCVKALESARSRATHRVRQDHP